MAFYSRGAISKCPTLQRWCVFKDCGDILCANTNSDHTLSLLIHLFSLALKADAKIFLDFQEQTHIPLKQPLTHLIP